MNSDEQINEKLFCMLTEKILDKIYKNIKQKSVEYNYTFHHSCYNIGENYAIGLLMQKLLYLKELYRSKSKNKAKIKKILTDIASYSVLMYNYILMIEKEDLEIDDNELSGKLDVHAISETIIKYWLDVFAELKNYIENIRLEFNKSGYVLYYKEIVLFAMINNKLLPNIYDKFENEDVTSLMESLLTKDYKSVIDNISNLLNKMGVDYETIASY